MPRAAFFTLFFAALSSGGLPTYSVNVLQIPSGFTSVTLSGINNSGQVTGNGKPGVDYVPFLSTTTGFTIIPLPPGLPYGNVEGLNNLGQVIGAGASGSSGPYVGSDPAFIGTTAGTTVIPLPAGWTSAQGYAINDSGQVAGSGGGPPYQAFVGTASGLVPIPLLPGYPISDGSAINASGMVAGFAVTSLGQSIAFIGTSNSATPLPMVSGWNFMTALAINSAGEVAGWGGDASGHTQAYLGTPAASSAIPMPYLATDTMIAAGSMNDARMVVGSSTISGVNLGGWIWDATDGPVLLNALVVSPAWNITNAISISGNGLILAQASYQGGPV